MTCWALKENHNCPVAFLQPIIPNSLASFIHDKIVNMCRELDSCSGPLTYDPFHHIPPTSFASVSKNFMHKLISQSQPKSLFSQSYFILSSEILLRQSHCHYRQSHSQSTLWLSTAVFQAGASYSTVEEAYS